MIKIKRNKRLFLHQGKTLKELRYKRDLTLAEVSQFTGIQVTRLFRLEACTHEISAGEIMSLERFYNVDIYIVLKYLGEN